MTKAYIENIKDHKSRCNELLNIFQNICLKNNTKDYSYTNRYCNEISYKILKYECFEEETLFNILQGI